MSRNTTTTTTRSDGPRRRVTLERTYDAPLEDAWELWTTKAGIESWWGPDGFSTEVHVLEVRPGGRLEYTMTAHGAPQIQFLTSAGRPLATRSWAVYTEVVPFRRLAYDHAVDFIPGTPAYQVAHLLELERTPGGVRMVLTFDAMHDEQMTRLATMGWENELQKLAALLEA
jgi:uncharacterized protein YndB with AHSA1/START domain